MAKIKQPKKPSEIESRKPVCETASRMTDSDDDSSEDDEMPPVDKVKKVPSREVPSETNKRPIRIRQYPVGSKGPFVVRIRVKEDPLESMKLQDYMFKKFKAVNDIRQTNQFSIRVTFAAKAADKETSEVTENEAREEANLLPRCEEWKKKYRIYIPEKLAEVIGCVSWSIGDDIDDLVKFGYGKFKNPLLPTVPIVEAIRFEKKTENDVKISLGTGRVIFAGLVLPDYIVINQMLIPVRPFHRRQMFCEACKSYNHTAAHCNNKPFNDDISEFSCIHCRTNVHETGARECPRRKSLEKRDGDREKGIRRKTFAEMLQQYNPNATMPGENMSEIFDPLRLGTKRSRQQSQPGTSASVSRESPAHKRTKNTHSTSATPPGFMNPATRPAPCTEDDVKSFLSSLVEDMEMPPAFTQFVVQIAAPLIYKLVLKFTNSIVTSMNRIGLQ